MWSLSLSFLVRHLQKKYYWNEGEYDDDDDDDDDDDAQTWQTQNYLHRNKVKFELNATNRSWICLFAQRWLVHRRSQVGGRGSRDT